MRTLFAGHSAHWGQILSYYVLVEDLGEREKSYGVEVRLKEECCRLMDLTSHRGRIETLMEALIRHDVTPVALRDVVEDWLLL